MTLTTGNDLMTGNKFGISLRKQSYVLNVSIRAHRFITEESLLQLFLVVSLRGVKSM